MPLRFVVVFIFWAISAACAMAHAADQGFVLLLPTEIYIPTGAAAFVLTVLIVAFLPEPVAQRLMTPRRLAVSSGPDWLDQSTSLAATLLFFALIFLGINGPRDPLSNLLPLAIWTVWWIGYVSLHFVVGGTWRFINPWTGLFTLVWGRTYRAPLTLPKWVGVWPAILAFVLFTSFSIADPTPTDPDRLAQMALGYWALTFLGMTVFGAEAWLAAAECFTIFFRLLSKIALLDLSTAPALGVFGWKAAQSPAASGSLAIFCLVTLGAGSFDGLNETFFWLAQIGVNPLDFPGRSEILPETILGFTGSILLLIAIFAACTKLGLGLAAITAPTGDQPGFATLFRAFAVATLPISLGFHVAHFLTTLLISGQYTILALSDPMATGANYLGLDNPRVLVGFLRDQEVVRRIWLIQAAIIVSAHIIAVMIANSAARRLFGTARQARLAELPLSLFMVAYTIFGLWLLAAARGA